MASKAKWKKRALLNASRLHGAVEAAAAAGLREVMKLRARVRALKGAYTHESDARYDAEQRAIGWRQDAEAISRQVDYYRDIVQAIGKMFGAPAYTSDDGSLQDDVLAGKVAELVTAAIRTCDYYRSIVQRVGHSYDQSEHSTERDKLPDLVREDRQRISVLNLNLESEKQLREVAERCVTDQREEIARLAARVQELTASLLAKEV